MQIWIKPPENYDMMVGISELFNARVGRVIYFGGSCLMQDANDKIDWVCKKLGPEHPASMNLASVRTMPMTHSYKVLGAEDDKIMLLKSEPGKVERELAPLVDDPESAADTIDHINFRKVMDTYSDCAVKVRKKTQAVKAQRNMLGVFKKHRVIKPVMTSIEKRIKKMQ